MHHWKDSRSRGEGEVGTISRKKQTSDQKQASKRARDMGDMKRDARKLFPAEGRKSGKGETQDSRPYVKHRAVCSNVRKTCLTDRGSSIRKAKLHEGAYPFEPRAGMKGCPRSFWEESKERLVS